MRMTQKELDVIDAMLSAITPGKWALEGAHGSYQIVVNTGEQQNGWLVGGKVILTFDARDTPDLNPADLRLMAEGVDIIRRLRAEVAAQKVALEKILAIRGGDFAGEDMRDIAEEALFPGNPGNRLAERRRTSLRLVEQASKLAPGTRLFYSTAGQPTPESMRGAMVDVIGPVEPSLDVHGIEKTPGCVRVRVTHPHNIHRLAVGEEVLAHILDLYVETDEGWARVGR